MQIFCAAKNIGVESANVTNPGPTNQIRDQPVKFAKTESDIRSELNGTALASVLIKEIKLLPAQSLQLPQRHDFDDLVDLGNQLLPFQDITLNFGNRALVSLPGPFHQANNSGLPPSVLPRRCIKIMPPGLLCVTLA